MKFFIEFGHSTAANPPGTQQKGCFFSKSLSRVANLRNMMICTTDYQLWGWVSQYRMTKSTEKKSPLTQLTHPQK